jgi:hypothetical protein
MQPDTPGRTGEPDFIDISPNRVFGGVADEIIWEHRVGGTRGDVVDQPDKFDFLCKIYSGRSAMPCQVRPGWMLPAPLHHVIAWGIDAVCNLRGPVSALRAKIVQELVGSYGWTLAETARRLGVSTSAVVEIFTRAREISPVSPLSPL